MRLSTRHPWMRRCGIGLLGFAFASPAPGQDQGPGAAGHELQEGWRRLLEDRAGAAEPAATADHDRGRAGSCSTSDLVVLENVRRDLRQRRDPPTPRSPRDSRPGRNRRNRDVVFRFTNGPASRRIRIRGERFWPPRFFH